MLLAKHGLHVLRQSSQVHASTFACKGTPREDATAETKHLDARALAGLLPRVFFLQA